MLRPVSDGREVRKMKDEDKTKDQLINELTKMRERISELETLEIITSRPKKRCENLRKNTETLL